MVTNRIEVLFPSNYGYHDFGANLVIPTTLLPAFIALVSRGINTWDQAPEEIKEFVDELTGNTNLISRDKTLLEATAECFVALQRTEFESIELPKPKLYGLKS